MKKMQKFISLWLALCLLVSMVPAQVFAAEAPSWETAENADMLSVTAGEDSENLQISESITAVVPFSMANSGGDKMDTSYLSISMEKYGEKISASSTSSNQVEVLPYTQWQMSARFVRIYDGKVEADQDVTDKCVWESTDSSGTVLSVSDKGLVTASRASDAVHSITASYEGFIGVPGDNGTQLEEKTFTAQMDFEVILPRIAEEDAEALRSLAFTYLATNEWDAMFKCVGMQISSWVDFALLGFVSLNSTTKAYIIPNAEGYAPNANTARVLHFLSAAAGDYTITKVLKSDTTGVRAVLFSNGEERYVAYAYKDISTDKIMSEHFAAMEHKIRRSALLAKADYDSFSKRFQDGYSFYTDFGGQGTNTKVTGQYVGGIIAKHISYITGSKCVSFNAPSPIQYTILNNFSQFCQNYRLENQTSYNHWIFTSPTLSFSSNAYRTEPGYETDSGLLGIDFIKYVPSKESISIPKKQMSTETDVNLWNRPFHLGNDSAETDIKVTERESVVLAGSGNDEVTSDTKLTNVRTALDIMDILRDLPEDLAEYFKKKKTKALQLNLYSVAVQVAEGYSMIDRTFFVGGKDDDRIYGPADFPLCQTSYIYSLGDGNDTYYAKEGCAFYFLNCENAAIYVYQKENDDKLMVSIDGADRITIDYSELLKISDLSITRTFKFYRGGPDDKNAELIKEITVDPTVRAGGDSSFFQVACPVDMLVYDQNGTLVQELLDGEEYHAQTEYGYFWVTQESDEYVKRAFLFDGSYRIQLRGVGTGTMKYLAGKMGMESTDCQYCSIEAIPVNEGIIYYPSDNMEEFLLEVDSNGDGTVDETITYDTTVSFGQDAYELSYGTQKQLTVDISTSSTDKDCCWFSTDNSVVTVDDEGTLTAVGFGEAEIYAMVADGSGAYDSCKVTVPQETLSAENFKVTGLEAAYEYTGELIDVQLLVSYGCFPLVQDVHYTAEFSELVEPGKATLTITGINDYSGTLTLNYEILAPEEPDTVAEKVDWIADQCREEGITDPWDIALWLHDWLIYNANYDYTYTYYHPEGVLLNGTGVCQSYAEAYALLLNEFSIENKVLSAPEMDHAWNLVRIDGEWCHIDCTWDDPGTGGAENYTYFGMTDALMQRDHTWDTSAYPGSTNRKNYYLIRSGANVVESQQELEDFLAEMAQEETSDFECYYIGGEKDYSIYESFLVWLNSNDWKYGIADYSIEGSRWMLRAKLVYSEPWDPPAEITDAVDCPRFTLRGPDGVYPMENYNQNGAVLIFGRTACGNTMALLSSLHPKLAELKSQGVQVFVNLENTNVASDYAALKQEYPSFTYTYYDSFLYSRLAELIGLNGVVYYPVVFIIKGGNQIVSASTGYVNDIDELLDKIRLTATYKPLPAPEPIDGNYYGSLFNYTGDRDALETYISNQLRDKNPVIAAYDGTWTGDPESWVSNALGGAMLQVLDQYRCQYGIPGYWSYYPGAQIVLVSIDYQIEPSHTLVSVPGKAATCNATGLTEGEKCAICGTVTVEQETIPVSAHTYDDNVDGTCNVCGINRETIETRQVTHMFRMYNPNTGEHFYTGSEEEKGNLVAVGWQYEGVGFTFPANTGAPVHRLFEPATGEHLYTMNEAEKASLMENGWNYEGIAFNSAYDTEAVQHRLHNPNATVGAYHFTFSEEERQNLINVGWEYQGIGWYSCWK